MVQINFPGKVFNRLHVHSIVLNLVGTYLSCFLVNFKRLCLSILFSFYFLCTKENNKEMDVVTFAYYFLKLKRHFVIKTFMFLCLQIE